MAPATAACPSLHELEGSCEYCGEPCDSTQDELNAINCTFEGCPSPEIYHQSCIEAYLKSIRLDKYSLAAYQYRIDVSLRPYDLSVLVGTI